MPTVGFIGLGNMGAPMVKNLLTAGYTVKVYDLVPQLVEALKQLGAFPASSLAEVAKDADVVITSLQTGAQVQDTCLGVNGIFNFLSPNALYIDCSSIDIQVCRELHEKAHAKKLAMLDAPVSGGVKGAEMATLTIMVGGADVAFERALTYLKHVGKKIIHAGPAGCGQAAKICNNMILAISMIGVSEAFVLAEKLGLDAKKFFEITSNASGQCWSLTSYCPAPHIIENVPSNNQYKPGFAAKMMLKDLNLSQDAAKLVHSYTPLGRAATEIYSRFVKESPAELDFSGVIQMIKEHSS